jgi:hypothetical protein
MRHLFTIITSALLLTACGPELPTKFAESQSLPMIYPDYTDVTIPVNLAPLTFQMDVPADEMAARFACGDQQLICSGSKIQPDATDWQTLVEAAKGRAITVDVYASVKGQWTHYKPFKIYVSPDSIDPYISYRLIAPSYVTYNDLTISQRCLENYDESVVYDNMLCTDGSQGQCINCHNYQNYNPNRMQFHARQNMGGTIVAYDGDIRKINMRNDSLLAAGVYPAWHPWLKLIVYSTNLTHQTFHTVNPNKIEVFDTRSDLMAFDVEKNEVTNLESGMGELEVFPCWSPDGKAIYYCSAHLEYHDSIDEGQEYMMRAEQVKYNIYKKDFDPDSRAFGPRQLVFDAAALDKSATLPRISPDGRYLMFAMARYGVFHIWHRDADLCLIDLKTGHARTMKEINSDDVESYHSWSSNGRWVVFSSRRYDGNFTRPFFAHIDQRGRGAKPFELPQSDPDYHRQFLRSYNIPEFMSGPVTIGPQAFARVLSGEGEPVKYVTRLSK